MELKPNGRHIATFVTMLLIVPYGIETYSSIMIFAKHIILLIVPYGIETASWPRDSNGWKLLIVPYGIETKIIIVVIIIFIAFNRTLMELKH